MAEQLALPGLEPRRRGFRSSISHFAQTHMRRVRRDSARGNSSGATG